MNFISKEETFYDGWSFNIYVNYENAINSLKQNWYIRASKELDINYALLEGMRIRSEIQKTFQQYNPHPRRSKKKKTPRPKWLTDLETQFAREEDERIKKQCILNHKKNQE